MSSAARSTVIDLNVQVHRTTERAVLVSALDSTRPPVWVPLSLIELEPHRLNSDEAVMTIPINIATEKGLI